MESNGMLQSPEKERVTTLMSSDGYIFPVEEVVIAEFQAIHCFPPAGGGAAIPISQITGLILAKVIDYCRKHNDHKLNRLTDQEISAWDRDFVVVNEQILVDLLMASQLLEVKNLFHLIMVRVADMNNMMKEKGTGNIEQLRNLFISNFRI